ILDEARHDFPQPSGTLSKAKNISTKTYQYINDWYNKIVQNTSETTTSHTYLTHLFIENYKMFSNLNLSFTNKEGKPLPVIILAGINGSGKTSLLEYIDKFITQTNVENKDYLEVSGEFKSNLSAFINKKNSQKIFKSSKYNLKNTGIAEVRRNIRYFPIDVNLTKDTQSLIVDYSNKLIKNKDYRPSEAYESIRKIMEKIFATLDLQVSFSRLDEKDNVFFKNQQGHEFPIDDLSTGEKTLLSKIFNLYVGDYSGKIILIDEPEISLHPSWQHKIINIYEDFCVQENSQVILATHSPQIIGSAKNESLRILSLNNGKIEVINDLVSYGRDINWVLTQVMGVESFRLGAISKRIEKCQTLLNDEQYDECEQCLDDLEEEIGGDDLELLQMRNILHFEQA
ncbi:MAG: AAA family ATPase, partial [Methylococcaceae bacterium]|nr:AAA family ATPase [Methylococcaceae bacterium]